MTASPLLPPGMTGPMTETEATDAELSRMTELALSRGAQAIAIGSGNSPAATRAVREFARRFQAPVRVLPHRGNRLSGIDLGQGERVGDGPASI
jgi:hypothetical protein